MKKLVLLAFLSVLFSTAIALGFMRPPVAHTSEANSSKTIWVPGNFTSIQEAINNASDGDTIYVRNGTYYEHLTIDKSLSLIGENKHNTTIDGNGTSTVIYITVPNVNVSGFTIRKSGPSFSGIHLENAYGWHGASARISHNIIANNHAGIFLHYSTNNVVAGNVISNNTYGILPDNSNSNVLTGNTVSSNSLGIWLYTSSNNVIFHNNFINNTSQASVTVGYRNIWDDGYPSGGNYWSNYNGTDFYNGLYQNETGSDGTGDTPHVIDADNQDGHPLMGPINFFNAGTWNETTYYVHTVSNSTVSDFYFSEDDKLVSYNVTGPDGSLDFCRVTIPKRLLWCDAPDQWAVLVNNTAVPYRVIENGDNTYLYFNYSHSIQNVQIEGIHVIPEFPTWISMLLIFIVLTVTIVIYKRRLLKTPIH